MIDPDSIFTVPSATCAGPLPPAGNPPAAAAAAACNISSFLILAASMLAARFGVGWLDDIPAAGFDTKDVSLEISFVFVPSAVELLLLTLALLFVAVVSVVVPVDILVEAFVDKAVTAEEIVEDAVDEDIDVIVAAIAGMGCVLMICIAGGFAEGGITGRAS